MRIPSLSLGQLEGREKGSYYVEGALEVLFRSSFARASRWQTIPSQLRVVGGANDIGAEGVC